MRNKLKLWGAGFTALLMVAGCATVPTPMAKKEAELGNWGVATADFDMAVDPGDDFFNYVNGGWLSRTEIPADLTRYGSFTVLNERSAERVSKIIQDLMTASSKPGSSEQKVGYLYASFMNTGAIEAKGYGVLHADLLQINSAKNHDDIAMLMADTGLNANAFFGGWVDVNPNQPDAYIFFLTQSGLGLPDRSYYLDERFAEHRTGYVDYMTKAFDLLGYDNAKKRAESVFTFEKQLAKSHWTRAERRDHDKTNNPATKAELVELAPHFPWEEALKKAGLGEQNDFIVREDTAFGPMAETFKATPVSTLQNYLTIHLLSNNAAYLPSEFDDLHFEFFGKVLSGREEQRERWKRGVGLVNRHLGEAVGQVYVKRHFPPEAKSQMLDLVGNIKKAFLKRLDENNWMSEPTKVEALAKMEKFTVKIGYPDEWKDYSSLEISADDLMGNVRAVNQWEWDDMLSKLGGPIDRNEWFMNPQTVNAYYSPSRNEIVFPAAILQPPFFDPNADPAVNYGGIGGVIGHEIGHGFDDQGRKSDGTGKKRDWWQPSDAAAFKKQTDRLGKQYDAYEPVKGHFVNGSLTMGENIGDLGGLELALEAYKMSLGGTEAPMLDVYTGMQRVFLGWAQVWRLKTREQAMIRRLATDPHSPAQYRVNGVVRNMDDWYTAFDVEPEDALYLPPEERVSIW